MFMVLNIFTTLVSANVELNPYEEDIKYYMNYLNSDPNNLKILNNLASIYLKLNHYNEANKILLKIINNKKHESQKTNKAALHTSGNEIKYFLNIEYARSHNLLALYFIKRKEFERAVLELNNALDITPESTKIKNNLGLAYKEIAADKLSKISISKKNNLGGLKSFTGKKIFKLKSNKNSNSKKIDSKDSLIKGISNQNKIILKIENTNEKQNTSNTRHKQKIIKEGNRNYDFKGREIQNRAVMKKYKKNTDIIELENLIPVELKNNKINELSETIVLNKQEINLSENKYKNSNTSLTNNKNSIVDISRESIEEETLYNKNSKENYDLENIIHEKKIFTDRYSESLNDWIFDEDK
jgi:tetratricopeptide (TPR) repeat protein